MEVSRIAKRRRQTNILLAQLIQIRTAVCAAATATVLVQDQAQAMANTRQCKRRKPATRNIHHESEKQASKNNEEHSANPQKKHRNRRRYNRSRGIPSFQKEAKKASNVGVRGAPINNGSTKTDSKNPQSSRGSDQRSSVAAHRNANQTLGSRGEKKTDRNNGKLSAQRQKSGKNKGRYQGERYHRGHDGPPFQKEAKKASKVGVRGASIKKGSTKTDSKNPPSSRWSAQSSSVAVNRNANLDQTQEEMFQAQEKQNHNILEEAKELPIPPINDRITKSDTLGL